MENRGYINEKDLKLAFSKFGREITDEELQEIMAKHSKGGQIYIDDFK